MGREVDGERGPTFVDTNAHEDTARQKTRQSPVIGLRFYYTLAHAGVPFPPSSSSLPAFPFFSPLAIAFTVHLYLRRGSPALRSLLLLGPTARFTTAVATAGTDSDTPAAEVAFLRCQGGRSSALSGKKKKERKKEQNNEHVFP